MSDRVISKSEILSRVPNKYALSSRAGVFLSMPIENKIVSVVDEESSTARLFHDTLCTIKGIDVFQFTDPKLDQLRSEVNNQICHVKNR